MKIAFRTRDLQSGKTSEQEFDSEQAAETWVADRPKFTEVLGLACKLPPELNDRLKAAARPLDAEEQVAEKQLEASIEEVLRVQAEARQKKEAKEAEERRAAMATADPNRPIDLRWTFNAGLSKVEADDPRDITDEAREAVMEWVKERDTWVESRGQVVGDARVTVYPGTLPEGVAERVKMGSFVPVTAAPKKK